MWKTALKALQGKKTYENWQEGFCQIFEAVLENKPFIMNVYRCVDRQKIESYLNKLDLSAHCDGECEKCTGMQVAEWNIWNSLPDFTNTVLWV